MKNFNNKLFNVVSILIFLFMVAFFNIISVIFIEHYADNFLISRIGSKSASLDNIIEVIVDDPTIKEHRKGLRTNDLYLYSDILDFFNIYASASIVGLDTSITYVNENNPAGKKFFDVTSKMKNLVIGFIPEKSYMGTDLSLLNNFKEKYALDVKFSQNIDLSKNEAYYNSVLINYQRLLSSVHNYGSVVVGDANNISDSNITEEKNNMTYYAYNIVKIGDSYYPSLPFKMFLKLLGTNSVVIDKHFITVPFSQGSVKIPYKYDKTGIAKTLIRYYKRLPINDKVTDYSHLNVSASAILSTYDAMKSGITPKSHPELYAPKSQGGKYINPEAFKDKIVIIGSNISGAGDALADVKATPISARHPGVDIQASILDNLISSDYYVAAWSWVNILILLILVGTSFAIIIRQNFLKGLISIILLDAGFLIFVALCAALFGLLLAYATPLVCQFGAAIFAYSFKFISESRNKEKIKQAMGKYLSNDIMKKIVGNIDDLKLGGKRSVVTVLFSDIRGFTSLSEKLSAEEVSMILNEYFSEMEPIITKYNGVINKFIGDAVMALFGDPVQDVNHPVNAVKCAYEMLKKVKYLREKWLQEGKPRIEIGIGINTGEVFIGNIGTESRMEYTVIGDTVNLASRIEGYNKVYKTNLLVSSSTYSYISSIADVIKISEVQIRGKSKKMDIYEILRIDLDK